MFPKLGMLYVERYKVPRVSFVSPFHLNLSFLDDNFCMLPMRLCPYVTISMNIHGYAHIRVSMGTPTSHLVVYDVSRAPICLSRLILPPPLVDSDPFR